MKQGVAVDTEYTAEIAITELEKQKNDKHHRRYKVLRVLTERELDEGRQINTKKHWMTCRLAKSKNYTGRTYLGR